MTKAEVIERLEAILEEVMESEYAVCYVTSVDAPALNAAVEELKNSERIAESAQNVQNDDLIFRKAAIDALGEKPLAWTEGEYELGLQQQWESDVESLKNLSSVQPERLSDDDFEAIRIHLNAYKEKLCNRRRWEEAEEYQRIIDRFMAFASAQPEQKKGKWIDQDEGAFYPIECSECHKEPLLDAYADYVYSDFCPNCGADMRGEQE